MENLEETTSCPPAIVLAGMHRSGIPLAACLLQSVGIDFVASNLDVNPDNPERCFEDQSFLSLNQAGLLQHGFGHEGYAAPAALSLSPVLSRLLRDLIVARRMQARPWGIMDPRSTLFLGDYLDALPNAFFVLLYRHPAEVIDSLFRCDGSSFRDNPALAIDSWIVYNTIVRDFCRLNPSRCLLVSAERLRRDPRGFVDVVVSAVGLHLDYSGDDSCLELGLLCEHAFAEHLQLLAQLRPDCIALYEELSALDDLVGAVSDSSSREGTLLGPQGDTLSFWHLLARQDTRSPEFQPPGSSEIPMSSRDCGSELLSGSGEPPASVTPQSGLESELSQLRNDYVLLSEERQTLNSHVAELQFRLADYDLLREERQALKSLVDELQLSLADHIQLVNELQEVREESEMRLDQLFAVQEELEHYFLLSQTLSGFSAHGWSADESPASLTSQDALEAINGQRRRLLLAS